MSRVYLAPYGQDFTAYFTLLEVDGVDFRVDAVHAAGDVTVIEDEGAEATADNGFTDEGTGYSLVCSAAELTGQRAHYYIVDQTATKVWLDTDIVVETYGHPDSAHPDLGVVAPDTGTAAAGAAGTITLATSASTTADIYNGMTVYIVAGTGLGQSRVIHDYSAARVASISPNWATTPDTTSKYVVVPTPPANQSEPKEVNVTQWSGAAVATPTQAGVPEVDITHVEGVANSTTTAQLGVNVVQISEDATAADRLEAMMDGILICQVNDASATTTAFAADGFTEATDDHFNGRLITFISGNLTGQQTDITDYDAAGGAQGSQQFTVTALTEAPANNDFFVIH